MTTNNETTKQTNNKQKTWEGNTNTKQMMNTQTKKQGNQHKWGQKKNEHNMMNKTQ